MRFFHHWDRLLALEADTAAQDASPWRSPQAVDDAGGACIDNLRISSRSKDHETSEYRLVLRPGDEGVVAAGKLSPSDCAILSAKPDREDEPVLVSSVVISDITANNKVTARLKKQLTDSAIPGHDVNGLRWRLDRETSKGLFARMRGALVSLLGSTGPQRLRELIVDTASPGFDKRALSSQLSCLELNMEQENAVWMMANAHDYMLLRGLPGAGKTHTLVAGIQYLMRQGRSVLVSAHTNSAVDNVLSRLIALGETPLRIGDASKVSETVQPFVLGHKRRSYTTVSELSTIVSSAQCVGCTCHAMHNAALHDLSFDICVMDEASQVLLPVSLRSIMRARQFVLCGDHAQLPPLVRLNTSSSGPTSFSALLMSVR